MSKQYGYVEEEHSRKGNSQWKGYACLWLGSVIGTRVVGDEATGPFHLRCLGHYKDSGFYMKRKVIGSF